MVTIIDRNEPVLRDIAAEVPVSDIKSGRLKKLIAEMKEALSTQDDGVAICAPQVGASLRMFVVAGRVFAESIEEDDVKKIPADRVFINPKILRQSKDSEWLEEGCLSLRYLYGKVKRAKKTRVSAYDENGKKFELGGSGLLSQIFQHEIDHLNGILFIDKAKDIKDIPPGTTI
jgi:peptide deformylase